MKVEEDRLPCNILNVSIYLQRHTRSIFNRSIQVDASWHGRLGNQLFAVATGIIAAVEEASMPMLEMDLEAYELIPAAFTIARAISSVHTTRDEVKIARECH